MFRNFIEKVFSSTTQVDVADDKNRFNVVYQKMLNTRWYITIITLLTLLFILLGVMASIIFNAHIAQEWKELLFLLLGAFIGSYNRVIDYWFNNSQRDDKLIEKMDQENDSDMLVQAKLKAATLKGNGGVTDSSVVSAVDAPAPVAPAAEAAAPAAPAADAPAEPQG